MQETQVGLSSGRGYLLSSSSFKMDSLVVQSWHDLSPLWGVEDKEIETRKVEDSWICRRKQTLTRCASHTRESNNDKKKPST